MRFKQFLSENLRIAHLESFADQLRAEMMVKHHYHIEYVPQEKLNIRTLHPDDVLPEEDSIDLYLPARYPTYIKISAEGETLYVEFATQVKEPKDDPWEMKELSYHLDGPEKFIRDLQWIKRMRAIAQKVTDEFDQHLANVTEKHPETPDDD